MILNVGRGKHPKYKPMRQLLHDVERHNVQYTGVLLKAHDRFLIIDEDVYHI